MTWLDHPRRYAAALAVLLVLLAGVIGVAVIGGGDDEPEAGGAPVASGPADGGAGSGGGADAPGQTGAGRQGPAQADGGAGDGEGSRPISGGAPDGGAAGGGNGSGRVDLTVRPGSIRGARVTSKGAVQTLPPDEAAHDTAQENMYPSIRSFGVEAEGEEATNITFALVQYLTAKAADDWATACARLYSVLRENIEKTSEDGSCPTAYGALMSRSSKERRIEQTKIDVSSVRRGEGNRAFVIYKTPETLSADMPMYVEDGVWKVGALEAYALTPDQVG